MVTFSRRLARRVRAVFRRALRPSPRGTSPSVAIVATSQVLRFSIRNEHIAVRYEEAGKFSPVELSVPLSFLVDIDGSRTDPVELLSTGTDSVLARWREEDIDQTRVVEQAATQEELPSLPALCSTPARLLSALRDASETAAAGSARYAIGCIQFRGQRGDIVATDGHQLLVQRGFAFPFNDDILIGHHDIFRSSELLATSDVAVGLRDGWFALRAGAWTVQIKSETEGRFPRIDDIIPAVGSAKASSRLKPADCDRLHRILPLLPGSDEADAPVTIDLNGQFTVRARSTIASAVRTVAATEVTLDGHKPIGIPTQVAINRRYLQRVGKLRLSRLHLFSARSPLLACDDLRSYVWMPLAESAIIPADFDHPSVVAAAA